MKQKLPLFQLLFLAIFVSAVNLQAQVKYPVSITNFQVKPSIFLSDYTSPGEGNVKATLRLNDHNEPQLEVYLKLTIESLSIKLTTSPAFKPQEVITLYTEEPLTLSETDFTSYFQVQHLLTQGISQMELQRTDQLPEGWYTFTLQVIDFLSGKVVSQPMSIKAQVTQIDPPTLVAPSNGQLISVKQPQIAFQWQQNANASLKNLQTAYYLRLYEIPETEKNPMQSIQNGAREVFQSDPIENKVYNYSALDVPLDPGKRYAYTVTIQEMNGRNWFKNKGVSEIGWFYYGYPTGGRISLRYPKNEEALSRNMMQRLEWEANDNLIDNKQPVIYHVKTVKIEESENPESAIDLPASWEQRTGVIFNKSGYSMPLGNVGSEERYAWQVKAYTDDVEVGKSSVQTFYSPPVIDNFVAGFGHIIQISKITKATLDDFAGRGKVKVSGSGKMIDVEFEHLQIENIGGLYLLVGGEIKCNVQGLIDPIELQPEESVNNKAVFYPDSIRIRQSDGMYLKGRVEWDFPFGTTEKEKSKVKHKSTWFGFNSGYRLSGTPYIEDKQGYNLLEPAKFRLELKDNSHIRVNENHWYMDFSGELLVNENIKGSRQKQYAIAFKNWEQLYYNEIQDYREPNEIHLIDNTKLYLAPRNIIVDLSETQSPQKFSGQPDWKGIYFENFDLRFDPSVDDKGQIKLTEEIFDNYSLKTSDTCKSWIIGDGLYFRYATKIASEGIVLFNTFPTNVDLFNISMERSNLLHAQLKGSIRIPVISQTERYAYTVPVTRNGFQTGYLDKSLEGLSFVFNEKSSDQRLEAKIKRAVFADYDHLDMDLELKWPKIGAVFTDLQQFNVWGNYEIGFVTPKGVANLTNQVQGTAENYAINVEQIGCGRMCNNYSFAISASVVIDNDISGPKGAPKLNIYSIASNNLLKGECDLPEQDIETPQMVENIGQFELSDEGVGEPGDEDNTSKAEMDALNAEMSAKMGALNNVTGRLGAMARSVSFDTAYAGSPYILDGDFGNDSRYLEGEISEIGPQEMIALLQASKLILDKKMHPQIDGWIRMLDQFDAGVAEYNDFIASLRNGDLLKMVVDMCVDAIMPTISDPIVKANNKAQQVITDFVEKYKNQALDQLDILIVSTANGFKTTAKEASGIVGDSQATEKEINKKIDGAVTYLRGEIRKAVDTSVHKNFTGYFTRFLDTIVYVRALAFVDSTIRGAMMNVVTGKAKEIKIENIGNNCTAMLNGMANDAKNLVDPENVVKMLENTGKGILNNFKWTDLVMGIGGAFLADKAVQEMSKYVPDGVKDLYNSIAGGIGGNIAANVSIDFNALKDGNIKDALKFDPTSIKIRSNVVEGEGYAKRIKDDPIYGDVFKANINAQIKMPVPFNVFGSFVSGKQKEQNFDYWFVEFGARKLGLTMAPVPLIFDGGSGRVFKHMSRTSTASDYIPDINNKFGAGVKAFFYDQSGGGIAVFDVDFEMKVMDDGFDLLMSGNALLGNNIDYFGGEEEAPASEPEKGGLDSVPMQVPVSKSLAIGYGEMGYSNRTNIFYASANVELGTSPILCGGGEFNARIEPGKWSLSVGTRENPIGAKLLCLNNISISSWLSIDKTMLDVGIKQNIDLSLRTPWIDFGVFDARGYAEFIYKFGGDAIIYWKPLKLKEAKVYADVRLAVGIEYKNFLTQKKIDLVGIGFGGNLTYLTRTQEELIADRGTDKEVTSYTGNSYALLYGRLYGYVTIIGIKIGLDFDAKKEWKS